VDPEGFEPSAFSMPLRRAPNCAMGPVTCNSNREEDRRHPLRILPPNATHLMEGWEGVGGPGGIRTLGLFSAIEARSQLRYRPMIKSGILPRAFYMCQAKRPIRRFSKVQGGLGFGIKVSGAERKDDDPFRFFNRELPRMASFLRMSRNPPCLFFPLSLRLS
jgi:hypothetical protein